MGYECEVINSYLDLHLKIDSDGKLRSKHDDKKDDINFPIWLLIISFVSSNFSNKNRKGNAPSRAPGERQLPFRSTWVHPHDLEGFWVKFC